MQVDYRVGHMTALIKELRDFGVIYISWGGLCWILDLSSWVSDMAD